MVSLVMPASARFLVDPEAAAILTPLRTFLDSQEVEAFLVGGYLRDALLGRPSHDIDLTVEGNAIAIAGKVADALGGSFVLLDDEHKIARVVILEDGGRWVLDFSAMRGNIEADLASRDFTINAMSVPLAQIEAGWNKVPLIDPLGGLDDLERQTIRATGTSAFRDDPARLLRAFRFSAELSFSIDSETEDLIERDRRLILTISPERVRDELFRILESEVASRSLYHLNSLGLLDLIIPELTESKGVEQPREHCWDVFKHSVETVAAAERLLAAMSERDELLDSLTALVDFKSRMNEEIVAGRTRRGLIKFVALLHDIGKPQNKQIEADGRIRFLGHAQTGATIVESVMERLRFSSREKRIAVRMVEEHLRPGHLSNMPEMPTRRAIYRYFRDTADVGIDVLFLSLADHLATCGPALPLEPWREHVRVTQHMLTQWFHNETTVSPPRIITGHDLIDEFGLSPGPRIGALLEAVKEAQAAADVQTRQDALDFVKKELDKNATY